MSVQAVGLMNVSVARDDIPGCEMGLFQPRKLSNMDCTFCLDCVHACPHENVGILVGLSRKEVWEDPVRSGIGRFWKRPDLAVVVLVLLFGALANAGAMVSPVVEWQESLRSALGNNSLLLVRSLYYLLCLVLLPLLSLSVVTGFSHRWGQLHGTWLDMATRFSYSLLPLGFSMWLAHYSFHFFGSYETVVPAVQRFLGDLGWRILGEPAWSLTCCRPVADWLPRLQDHLARSWVCLSRCTRPIVLLSMNRLDKCEPCEHFCLGEC